MSENTLITITANSWGLLFVGFVILWVVVLSWTVFHEARRRQKLDQKIQEIKASKADKTHYHPWQDITGKPTSNDL